jgi:hypothetical protein
MQYRLQPQWDRSSYSKSTAGDTVTDTVTALCVSYEGMREAIRRECFAELSGGGYRPWFYNASARPSRCCSRSPGTWCRSSAPADALHMLSKLIRLEPLAPRLPTDRELDAMSDGEFEAAVGKWIDRARAPPFAAA